MTIETPQSADHEPMLAGSLVRLRPGERADIPLFVRWLSDARTTRHLALRSPIGLAMEERWFETMLDQHGRDRWFFVIARRADGRAVGSIDLHEVDHVNGGAGLGIAIGDPLDTSQGYGSEAISLLLDFAFGELRLRRVWLDVYDDNAGARRLYERLGFVREATFRRGLFRHGRFIDVHRLGILVEEWPGGSGLAVAAGVAPG
jgi:RimJ/RimL family protein N-acetyltransferase